MFHKVPKLDVKVANKLSNTLLIPALQKGTMEKKESILFIVDFEIRTYVKDLTKAKFCHSYNLPLHRKCPKSMIK